MISSLKLTEMCTHCGFCLETCPTYVVTRNEVHSPRGRIEAVRIGINSTGFETCMYCRLCETACPAGVKYAQIITPVRKSSLKKTVMEKMLENPKLLAKSLKLLSKANSYPEVQRFVKFVKPNEVSEPLETDGEGDIILFPGCIESVIFRKTVEKAYKYLGKKYKVKIINGCCGLAHISNGNYEGAKKLAIRLAEKVKGKKVITLQSNCAAFMKEYKEWFGIEINAYDFAEFLIKEGIELPKVNDTFTVHYPCHAYRQKLVSHIRNVAEKMGIKIREMEDPHFECGAGGDYWLSHPKLSDMVMNVKRGKIAKSEAKKVIVTNSVCALAIRSMGYDVYHIADLLDT
ncbi:(Fe-S)-binding protein [Saccharolobus solfataricus]|uniref:Glycolate oxidase iron-sulfur subunit. (GlcF) n=3 Tax=Saccharolobus solfataricus TaxID=2287 RepID=Q97U61_SACS2|nr:(Fe-S)-binding protein [Saccharolobus solfataricus]AAK43261.1 Glycolate oxidase iron-sulfur subunit. (glcF) [Saccharolobus solfataricus P2]AKA73286.1 (Fe-S)-binding protein [Saccharolobus solfataricus]AKA75985.1 (Fe-S)-binding protein [Saccharolobus solfataricus]AKA78678.1 (Fe-S)-binding protein [Saccharolobus solfataricus]AZF67752.1 (Fe-S)-binding protein [Saccharolobus solfataricus]